MACESVHKRKIENFEDEVSSLFSDAPCSCLTEIVLVIDSSIRFSISLEGSLVTLLFTQASICVTTLQYKHAVIGNDKLRQLCVGGT